MKRNIILIAAAACCLIACGRTVSIAQHEADKRSFNAWVTVQKEMHPEYLWRQTPLGSYILEETEGTGDRITGEEDSLYVRLEYTSYSTAGKVLATTSEKMAQQLGTYSESSYYGPTIWYGGGIYAGIEEILTGMKDPSLSGMRDGGRRKVVIPGWLITYNRYDEPEKYLNDSTSNAPLIYDIKLVEHFRSVKEWEVDSISRYLVKTFPSKFGTDPAKAKADSSGAHGFFYIQTQAPTGTEELKDTTVSINYIGRLLNGLVFDTTIRDTAIFYGIYSSSRTYGPVSVKYGTSVSEIKLGSSQSSVVEGFGRTLCKMKMGEKGIGIFPSPLGYSYSGSGSSIPAYAPLRFDIEIVN
ncbi:MAG: FKBP-type peptidyl-prolyl cis-trans isomerase [Bacteroidales bacterium]|nr:FKBP-type peptidyl-prolyl cis-trans isomerase [Bacteroidales bacterium]